MTRSHKILLGIISVCFLFILSGCGPTQEFSPGRYQTIHQGQSWILDFDPDGSWSGTFSGDLFTSGTYSIDGDQLTWLTDSHCLETGYPGPATYRLRIRNSFLTFSRIGSDPCLSRQVILEDERYQKLD